MIVRRPRAAAFLLALAALLACVELTRAATPPAAPAGARRWDIPGGFFMLPDWEVKHHTVEKAMGTVAVSRPGAVGGGLCLAWTYQSAPLSPKELADGAPAYAALLRSFLKEGASLPDAMKVHGENEVEVIDGHAAVIHHFAAGETEATLALWDCAQSKRTFAVLCFAPQKSIAGRIFYAIAKYASCHSEPVTYEATGPLAITAPPDWKPVVTAPTQQILASPDQRSAVYLFKLAPGAEQKVTGKDAEAVVATVARLAGKLEKQDPPEIVTDAKLGHDVARVRTVLQVERRSATGLFDVWYCPVKQRVFCRAALSEAADGLEKARELLDTVRCH